MRTVVEDGTPVAALSLIGDPRRLLRLDEIDQEAREVPETMRAPYDDVPTEAIARQTGRTMAESRQEDRTARERITRAV